jgi:hypothetical protein
MKTVDVQKDTRNKHKVECDFAFWSHDQNSQIAAASDSTTAIADYLE